MKSFLLFFHKSQSSIHCLDVGVSIYMSLLVGKASQKTAVLDTVCKLNRVSIIMTDFGACPLIGFQVGPDIVWQFSVSAPSQSLHLFYTGYNFGEIFCGLVSVLIAPLGFPLGHRRQLPQAPYPK